MVVNFFPHRADEDHWGESGQFVFDDHRSRPGSEASMNPALGIWWMLTTLWMPTSPPEIDLSRSMLETSAPGKWTTTLSRSEPGFHDRQRQPSSAGDDHPVLFGRGDRQQPPQWKPPVAPGFISETVRGVLRDHLLNDPEYTTSGYGTDLGRISVHGPAQQEHQWKLNPVSYGGLDLGFENPLLDSSVPDYSIILAALEEARLDSPEILRNRFEIMPWPRWDSSQEGDHFPSLGGIRATLGVDSISPLNCSCLSFQVTANFERGGDTGLLFQICWQGNPGTP